MLLVLFTKTPTTILWKRETVCLCIRSDTRQNMNDWSVRYRTMETNNNTKKKSFNNFEDNTKCINLPQKFMQLCMSIREVFELNIILSALLYLYRIFCNWKWHWWRVKVSLIVTFWLLLVSRQFSFFVCFVLCIVVRWWMDNGNLKVKAFNNGHCRLLHGWRWWIFTFISFFKANDNKLKALTFATNHYVRNQSRPDLKQLSTVFWP